MEVAVLDSVALKTTWIEGCPKVVARIVAASAPRVDRMVSVIMKPSE